MTIAVDLGRKATKTNKLLREEHSKSVLVYLCFSDKVACHVFLATMQYHYSLTGITDHGIRF